MIKFERLKSHKGVKLKNICNFIDNSKIKKNINQMDMDQM
jgi:hypothetical protein